MFASPRYVVIDDKKNHLQAIVEAFQSLGTPCVGVHYQSEHDPDPKYFSGVRCLFMDLHLNDSGASSDSKQHFATIASILRAVISPDGGPYALFLWTEHAQHSQKLSEYLDSRLNDDESFARPVAVLALDKNKYIEPNTGTPTSVDKLSAAIRENVENIPQLAALMEWELSVLGGVNKTLAALADLVPSSKKNSNDYPDSLDATMSILAAEAVGKNNVGVNPKGALSECLAPILQDRLLYQISNDESEVWTKAVTKFKDPNAEVDKEQIPQINRMLHFSTGDLTASRPTDWGAVIEFPNLCLKDTLGLTYGQILGGEMKVDKESRRDCNLRWIRVGAQCDYSQNSSGPIQYLLGVEIPLNAKRMVKKVGDDNEVKLKPTDAIWISPPVSIDNSSPFELHVHSRLSIVKPVSDCESWSLKYRMRESLMAHLVRFHSNYISRLGIIRVPIRR